MGEKRKNGTKASNNHHYMLLLLMGKQCGLNFRISGFSHSSARRRFVDKLLCFTQNPSFIMHYERKQFSLHFSTKSGGKKEEKSFSR
jgi:hypothetical protein